MEQGPQAGGKEGSSRWLSDTKMKYQEPGALEPLNATHRECLRLEVASTACLLASLSCFSGASFHRKLYWQEESTTEESTPHPQSPNL